MISKISTGTDPGGLCQYLAGPGKHNEHTRPHTLAGSVQEPAYELGKQDAARMAEDLRAYQRQFGTQIKGGHVWHCSLSLSAQEGSLSDAHWSAVADDFMKDMGFTATGKAPVRWTAVHHGLSTNGNDHIHIVASLIREDGTRISTWQDKARSQKVMARIEQAHKLKVLPSRAENISVRAYSKDDSGRSKDLSLEPSRLQTERAVRAAASAAHSEGQFVKLLEREGLTFVPYQQNGQTTGYSVKDANGFRWAGGKLARDLSLPRLRQSWQEPEKKTNAITASKELADINAKIPTASTEELQDISHQLAGALAAASLQVEPLPGQFAAASHEAGVFAQTRTYVWKKKPPALGVGLLLMQAQDPTGPVGKTVLMRQLLATYNALRDAQTARRGLANSRGRIPSMTEPGPDEELMESGVTTMTMVGAMAVEGHARRSESDANNKPRNEKLPPPGPWDADTFRRIRAEDNLETLKRKRALTPPATAEQLDRIQSLQGEIGIPNDRELISHLTRDDAVALLGQLEQVPLGEQWKIKPPSPLPDPSLKSATGLGTIRTPDDAQAFLNRLERSHESRVLADAESTELPAAQRAVPAQKQSWEYRSGQDEPLTPRQEYVLKQRGVPTTGVTKAEASLLLGDKVKDIDEARQRLRAAGAALTPQNPGSGLTQMPDQVKQQNTKGPKNTVRRT